MSGSSKTIGDPISRSADSVKYKEWSERRSGLLLGHDYLRICALRYTRQPTVFDNLGKD